MRQAPRCEEYGLKTKTSLFLAYEPVHFGSNRLELRDHALIPLDSPLTPLDSPLVILSETSIFQKMVPYRKTERKKERHERLIELLRN